MHDYEQLTSKYLMQNKKRVILTIIGIALAVSLFSGISTLFLSYRDLKIQDAKKNVGNYEVNFKRVDEVQLDKIINNAEIYDYGVMKDIGIANIVDGNHKQPTGKKDFSIEIKSYDKQAYNNIFNNYFDIKKGRLPVKEGEIVLEARVLYSLGDKKVGDKISVDSENKDDSGVTNSSLKEYVIVGTYEANLFSTAKFPAITFLSNKDIKNKGIYDIFINLKERKDKVGLANNLAKELKLDNSKDFDKSQVSINNEYVNPNYKGTIVVRGYENYIYGGNSIMSFYDDNAFETAKKYLIDGIIDKKALNNMGVLLVRKGNKDYSTYKVGDKIVIPKIKSYQWGEVDEKYKNGKSLIKNLKLII